MAKKLDTKIFAIRDLDPTDRVPSHFCAIHHNFAVFLGRQGWMSQGAAVEGCGKDQDCWGAPVGVIAFGLGEKNILCVATAMSCILLPCRPISKISDAFE